MTVAHSAILDEIEADSPPTPPTRLAAVGAHLSYAISGVGRNPRRRVRIDEAALTIALRRDFSIAAALGVTLLRSWGIDAVDRDLSIPTRPAIRIEARLPAPSLSRHRRRWLVPVEPRPPAGQIMIPALPLDEP